MERDLIEYPHDKDAFFSDLKSKACKHIVVDFDHTLLLGNSTELFIDTIRPRWLAWLLSFIGRGCAKVVFRNPSKFNVWCDFFRVGFVVFGMPWSLFQWRRSAKAIMRERLNHRLFEGLQTGEEAKILIVSLGFISIIRPLLDSLGREHDVIASRLTGPLFNIRVGGKVAAIQQRNISCRQSLVITDSLDDAELLKNAAKGYLIQWEIKPMRPPAYFPLRYTFEAKYRLAYLLSQFLAQDLVFILLAYCKQGVFAYILLLYLSFLVVYEMGYYENDFSASRLEAAPTRHRDFKKFQDYNISMAWGWVFGICIIITIFNSFQSAFIWFLFLLSVRMVFHFYNKLPAQQRVLIYFFLQLFKYFGYTLLVTPYAIGTVLLGAQTTKQTISYGAYRILNKIPLIPLNIVRLICFFFLFLVVLTFGGWQVFGDSSLLLIVVTSLWVLGAAIMEGRKLFGRLCKGQDL